MLRAVNEKKSKNSSVCRSISCCHACEWFYRNIMTFVPAGFALLAILTLATLAPQRIGRLSKGKREYFTSCYK